VAIGLTDRADAEEEAGRTKLVGCFLFFVLAALPLFKILSTSANNMAHHRYGNFFQTIRDRILDCSESLPRGKKALEWLEKVYQTLTRPFANLNTFDVSNKREQHDHDVMYKFNSFAQHVLNSFFSPSNI
jgi:hypothetical protein